MKVVISQPRYLPALNYINRLAKCDRFILLDTVQRQSRGWENRNKLLCNGNAKWVSIPIDSSSRALISDTQIKGVDWINNHKNTIRNYYRQADCYDEDQLESYYKNVENTLKANDHSFTETILQTIRNLESMLDFECDIVKASELEPNRNHWLTGPEELKRIAKLAGATVYVSGPNAKEYGIEEVFDEIDVEYHEYDHPIYDQQKDSFTEYLGFFDALYHTGYEQVNKWVHQELDTTKITG